MDEYRMARRVLMADVSGERVWGRSALHLHPAWMGGMKVAEATQKIRSVVSWCICR